MIASRLTPKLVARVIGAIVLLFLLGQSIMQMRNPAKSDTLRVVYMPRAAGCSVKSPSGNTISPGEAVIPDGAIMTGQCLRTARADEE